MIHVLIVLLVVGVILGVVVTYVPMEPTIKRILVGVVVLALVLWLLSVFGLLDSFPTRVRL